MGGMAAWMSARGARLDPATTFVVGLDTVGSGEPVVLEAEGASGRSATARRTWRWPSAPPAAAGVRLRRWRLGAWTDPVLARLGGLPAVSLLSVRRRVPQLPPAGRHPGAGGLRLRGVLRERGVGDRDGARRSSPGRFRVRRPVGIRSGGRPMPERRRRIACGLGRDRARRHLQDAGGAGGQALARRGALRAAQAHRRPVRGPARVRLVLLIPLDLEPNQHRLAAVLAFVIVWWITEAIPIPVTALLGVTLCALLEATPPPEEGDSSVDVVFSLFTDDTIFLFIGSFIIAEAMVVHGLHRRLAYRVLAMRPWAARPSGSSSPSGSSARSPHR